MKLDPYTTCPCGSGQNLKWCCAEDFPTFLRASRMIEAGQADGGAKLMEDYAGKKPDNARLTVLLARVLYAAKRTDHSREAVERALALDPNLPSGLLLHGMILCGEDRAEEGLRQLYLAAEHFPEKQASSLVLVYGMIADFEIRRNNFVAARASLERELKLDPKNAQRRELFERIYNSENDLPPAAKKDYPPRSAPENRRAVWAEALKGISSQRRLRWAAAFQQIVEGDPSDTAARYNLALLRAQLGQPRAAMAELEMYADAVSDAAERAGAMALREVLSVVTGTEAACDWLTSVYSFPVADGRLVNEAVQALFKEGRLVVVDQNREDGSAHCVLFPDAVPAGAENPPKARAALARINFNPAGVVVYSYRQDHADKAMRELGTLFGFGISKPTFERRFTGFETHVVGPLPIAMTGPEGEKSPEWATLARDNYTEYFEAIWFGTPLHALGGMTPRDASADPVRRNRLEGIIRYWEDLAILTAGEKPVSDRAEALAKLPYQFDRLRRELNLVVA